MKPASSAQGVSGVDLKNAGASAFSRSNFALVLLIHELWSMHFLFPSLLFFY
jgi:hypothetical protein